MLTNFKTKLIFKQSLTPDVYLFRFQLQEPSELYFIAGQYMILMIPQSSGNPLRRLYSICSSEKQTNSFELIIKLVNGGVGSDYLKNIKIGDWVDFQGPAGQFFLRENNSNKIFLATGTGIAPMLSMIDKISNTFQVSSFKFRVFLFWGLATYQDVFYFDELKQIKKENPNFDFKICLSREKDLSEIPNQDRQFFSLGHINSLLTPNPYLLTTDYYICGRREMVEGLRIQLAQLGVDRERIYFEKF